MVFYNSNLIINKSTDFYFSVAHNFLGGTYMNMQNVSCCEGCFYAGVPNGYRPECSCETREIIEAESQIKEQDLCYNYTEETLSSFSSVSQTGKDRATAIQRRANRAKAVKRTAKNLPIVESKLNKLPSNASGKDFSIADKKVANVAGIAKPRYQAALILPFPEIPKSRYGKCSIFRLIDRLKSWERDAESPDPEKRNDKLALACKKAIKMLNTATLYDGELCSLHREGNDLHIKLGFLNKTSLSNFERKLSKIPAATI